ncbi:hypothetical protein [Nonomuraea insulae]|uniref:TraD/TraG TraM recognition site domain-containing protein n=1 Tax=Nonomuraea insulae TaxID=1616787 RepID=A0ABW1CKR9_9ACTN
MTEEEDRAAADGTAFERPLRRQHRLLGWALRLIGASWTGIGSLMFIVAYNRTRTIFVTPTSSSEVYWTNLAVVASIIVAGAALLLLGRRMRWQGRRHGVPVLTTMEEAKRVPYVLYLRPFASDKTGSRMRHAFSRHNRVGGSLVDTRTSTVEENLARSFRQVGRVIAVGRPEERLPLPGAARLYLPWDGWRPAVRSLIDDARMVLLATGDSEGTLWEFEQLLLRRGPHGLLLVVYSDETEYDNFRRRAHELFDRHAERLRTGQDPDWQPPVLPPFPRLRNPSAVKWLPITRAYLRFDADWRPHLVLLDPTAAKGWTVETRLRRIGREQVAPLVLRLYEDMLAAEEAADHEDARRCVTVVELAAAITAARAHGGEDTTLLPVRFTGTGRFLSLAGAARSVTAEDAPASGPEADLAARFTTVAGSGSGRAAQAGGRAPFTIELPLFWLEERLSEVRERGAADQDILRLELSAWGRLQGVRHEPGSLTGAEVGADPD